jgi:hypothetical protein
MAKRENMLTRFKVKLNFSIVDQVGEVIIYKFQRRIERNVKTHG